MSVTMLHPLGLDHRSMQHLKVKCNAPDLPGHGVHADQVFQSMRLEDAADIIAGSIEQPTHLVGASLGGMIAMLIAIRYPERVRSLVLVATAARGSASLEERANAWRQPNLTDITEQTITRWFGESVPPDIEVYGREALALVNPQTLANYWSAMAKFDVRSSLEQLTVPVTCIAALDDVSSPPAALQELTSLIPQAKYVEVPGPHMALMTHPTELSAAIREHLEHIGS